MGVPVPIAYAAVSPFEAPVDWLCLAPVAVAPEEQGRGVATALLRHVVAGLMAEKRTVVVLGEPRLYARAGFSTERASRLVTPYPLGATLIARPGTDTPGGAAGLQPGVRGRSEPARWAVGNRSLPAAFWFCGRP